MNWRRGLLLAAMNLLAAVPLICLLAAQDAQYMKEREQQSVVPEMRLPFIGRHLIPQVEARLVRVQEEQTVSFDPCSLMSHYPPQVSVVQAGSFPVTMLSQWQVECPSNWSVARKLGVTDAGRLAPVNIKAARRVDVALCLMIAIQWFLIGGFPLRQSGRWWGEPGAFISANNFVAACIGIIPVIDGLARLPALIAFGGWVWWLGLILWKIGCLAWQSTLGGLRRLTH